MSISEKILTEKWDLAATTIIFGLADEWSLSRKLAMEKENKNSYKGKGWQYPKKVSSMGKERSTKKAFVGALAAGKKYPSLKTSNLVHLKRETRSSDMNKVRGWFNESIKQIEHLMACFIPALSI